MSTVASFEDRVQTTARAIFAGSAGERPRRLSRARLQGEMMEWAMTDERLKVQLLRFVDVFPTLRSRDEIARHLREYFVHEDVAVPAALRWGVGLTGQHSPLAPLASAVIRGQMKGFAQRFIVGRDARDAVPVLRALRAGLQAGLHEVSQDLERAWQQCAGEAATCRGQANVLLAEGRVFSEQPAEVQTPAIARLISQADRSG